MSITVKDGRVVTPVRAEIDTLPESGRPPRAVVALVLVSGLMFLISAWMPWFSSHVGASVRDINGLYRGSGNAWLFGVPIGWVLTVAGVSAIAYSVVLIAPHWPFRVPRATAAVVGLFLLVAMLAERSYVHHQVDVDLRRVLGVYATAHPDQLGRVQATLASGQLHLDDAIGIRIGLTAAAGMCLAGAWLLKRRHPTGH